MEDNQKREENMTLQEELASIKAKESLYRGHDNFFKFYRRMRWGKIFFPLTSRWRKLCDTCAHIRGD